MVSISPGFRPTLKDDLDALKKEKRYQQERQIREDKAKIQAKIEEEVPITEADLQEFDTVEVMDTARFLALAKKTIENADRVVDRADLFLEKSVPNRPLNVPASMKENLDVLEIPATPVPPADNPKGPPVAYTLSPAQVDCVTKIAATNQYEDELTKHTPTPTDPNAALATVNKISNEEIDKNFPQFGISLILMLFWIIFKLTVQKILGAFCRFFKKLNFEVVAVKVRIGDMIIETVIEPVGYFLIRSSHVCDEEIDINLYLEQEVAKARKHIMEGGIYDPYKDVEQTDKCDPNYIPRNDEIAAAREINKEMMKNELNEQNTTDHRATLSSVVRQSRSTAVRYGVYGGDIIKTYEEAPGVYHVTEVQGTIIGFFSQMNGILKGIDKGISAAVQLRFLTPRAREWVCCFVRIFYYVLPHITGKKDAKGVYDFFQGKAGIKIGKKEKLIAEALDIILGYALGSSYINIDLEFPFDTDLIMAAFYESLAEVLGMIMDMIYQKLDLILGDLEGTCIVRNEDGGISIGTQDSPQEKVICFDTLLALCPPFQYFWDLIRCNINNLLGNIFDLLAMLWLKGNEMMKSFDSTIDIVIMARNVNFFKNIIRLLENLGARLRQFCDLDKVTTPEDVEAILAEVDKADPDGAKRKEDREQLTAAENSLLMTPTYPDPDIPLGPDPDAYVNADLLRRDRGAGVLDVNLQNSPLYPRTGAAAEEQKKEVEAVGDAALDPKSPLSDSALDPNATIEPCGDAFKELLQFFDMIQQAR